MKKIRGKECGLLSLEACIAVTIFIFLMLFMYSFFVVFEARNEMGHAVLATTNSLALDAYDNSTMGGTDTAGQIIRNVYGSLTNGNSDFTDYRQWYDSATTTDANGNTMLSASFSEVVKNRFLAYLSGGDADKAETLLARYHIQNGVDGLDFSNSYVSDGKLYISVRYTIEYEFQVFNLDVLKMEQKACSKLWNDEN